MISLARHRIGLRIIPQLIRYKSCNLIKLQVTRAVHNHRDWFEDYNHESQGKYRNKKQSYFGQSTLVRQNWSELNLEEFEKNLYEEHPNVSERSQEEVQHFLKSHQVTVQGADCPKPILNFNELNIPESLRGEIERQEWNEPTPIQAISWPIAMSGRDMVAISQTGSGKTAGYILPALLHAQNQRKLSSGEGPICLVLVPTRELSRQVSDVSSKFVHKFGMRQGCLYGGDGKKSQMGMMRRGVEVCSATPGRLIDLLEMGVFNLHRTTYLVLDEADRMLDMGFEPQIRKIIDQIRPNRQTLMWSATWPSEVQQLAFDFMRDFVQVKVGSLKLQTNKNIEQIVKVCLRREKMSLMMELLAKIREDPDNKTLIFTETKVQADIVCEGLQNKGFPAISIHGDKTQQMRDRSMHAFRSGKRNILIATDVASRGLDVNDIKFVINYDHPRCIEDYVHRIGRTARASNTGTAITLFTPEDAPRLQDLIKVLKEAKQDISSDLLDMLEQFREFKPKSKSRDGGYRKPSGGYRPRDRQRQYQRHGEDYRQQFRE